MRILEFRWRCSACIAAVGLAAACHGSAPPFVAKSDPPSAAASAPAAVTVTATASATVVVAPPAAVDLRDELTGLGLVPRPQGGRGTCSVFTTCAAIEVALAKHRGHAERLSPEFLNWSGSQVIGRPSDGAFFHNALAGFAKYGICADTAMPYEKRYHANHSPSAEALAQAEAVREESRDALAVHWIVPWQPNRFGLSDEQFAAVKAVLARGFPVAAGSGHSRLLVGYRDDPALPGGGAFLTEDSALARFDEVTYDFVRQQVADVFWVEALPSEGVSATASSSR
jgi:hypothetical protein